MDNKNEELIKSMMSECHDRIVTARKQIDDHRFNAARTTLYSVTTLLESLSTLEGRSKFEDD